MPRKPAAKSAGESRGVWARAVADEAERITGDSLTVSGRGVGRWGGPHPLVKMVRCYRGGGVSELKCAHEGFSPSSIVNRKYAVSISMACFHRSTKMASNAMSGEIIVPRSAK